MAIENAFVVIVSASEGVVLKGIERKLQSLGMETRFVGSDLEQVRGHIQKTDIYVLYLSPELIAHVKLLFEIDKIVRQEGKEMVVIGEKVEQEDAKKACFGMHVFSWVDRPVDMDSFLKVVEGAITQSRENNSRKHILIVDDDPTYSKMVQLWLRDIYRITIVNSGMDAVKFLTEQPADLVLLDYEMPVVNGPQTLEILRSDEATSAIPVVFLTGKGKKEDVTSVMALKPVGYILKTTTKEDLREFIKQKLG